MTVPHQDIVQKTLLDPSAPVPTSYSQIFAQHLQRFPNDTHFAISFDPDTYGIITCLERGCAAAGDINLGPDPAKSLGGLNEGFGNLSKFEEHIRTHPTHSAARNRRIAELDLLKKESIERRNNRKRSSRDADLIVGVNNVKRSKIEEDSVNFIPIVPDFSTLKMTPIRPSSTIIENSNFDPLKGEIIKEEMEEASLATPELTPIRLSSSQSVSTLLALNALWPNSLEPEKQLGVLRNAFIEVLKTEGTAEESLPQQVTDQMDCEEVDYLSSPTNPATRHAELAKVMKEASEGDFEGSTMTVEQAMAKLGIQDEDSPLPNSQVTLLRHQILGVAWMVEQEKSRNRGGLLCDEMGLGKTIQTIGLFVKNPSENPRMKTTLVVAPLSLLDQWKNEINQYADHLEVLIYHKSGQKVGTTKELAEYDIVLTNYETLRLHWPDDNLDELGKYYKPKSKKKKTNTLPNEDEQTKPPSRTRKLGILMKMKWYRVVLDEAHTIRTLTSLTCKSVTRGLQATYRWCLSGTPLINGLRDAFPLLKFIRLRVWSDWTEFSQYVLKGEGADPGDAGQRLQAIFKSCMFRRRKTSILEGKPIITLPPKIIEDEFLEFSEEERQIYESSARREQAKFNKFLREGTVLKNFAQVLVMLLRLRQICNHPCLITEQMDPFDFHETNPEKVVSLAMEKAGHDFVMKLKRTLRERLEEKSEVEKRGKDVEIYDECPICADAMETSYACAPCCHIFCDRCLGKIWTIPAPVDEPAYKENERPCPTCRGPISKTKSFNVAAFQPTEDDTLRVKRLKRLLFEESDDDDDSDLKDFVDDGNRDIEHLPESRPQKVKKEEREASTNLDSDYEMETVKEDVSHAKALKECTQGRDFSRVVLKSNEEIKQIQANFTKMIPSTKMIWMMEQLKKWRQAAPDDKVIIISQWTSCLDLLATYLDENDLPHVSYRGDIPPEERAETVSKFQKGKIKYMLLSLKCGGVGLNLTKANRIINFDLAWSEAVEAQAFDRCHRIGQRKTVLVKRPTIINTVEGRIKELQERKRALVEASLGEGNGKKLGNLSVKDLCYLFGVTPQ